MSGQEYTMKVMFYPSHDRHCVQRQAMSFCSIRGDADLGREAKVHTVHSDIWLCWPKHHETLINLDHKILEGKKQVFGK
jgi:hypothetical protein